MGQKEQGCINSKILEKHFDYF